MKKDIYTNFVVYRRADETYYRYYQETRTAFTRVSVSPDGTRTHLSFLKFSDVSRQLFNLAQMGYSIADLSKMDADEQKDIFKTIRSRAING